MVFVLLYGLTYVVCVRVCCSCSCFDVLVKG